MTLQEKLMNQTAEALFVGRSKICALLDANKDCEADEWLLAYYRREQGDKRFKPYILNTWKLNDTDRLVQIVCGKYEFIHVIGYTKAGTECVWTFTRESWYGEDGERYRTYKW